MRNRKNPSLYRLTLELKDTFFKITKDFAALANAEATLALRSFISITILSVLFRTLLITTWLSLCAALAFYLAMAQDSWLLSFAEIAFLNFVLMLFVGVSIIKMKNNLTFSATRRQLHSLSLPSEDSYVDETITR